MGQVAAVVLRGRLRISLDCVTTCMHILARFIGTASGAGRAMGHALRLHGLQN